MSGRQLPFFQANAVVLLEMLPRLQAAKAAVRAFSTSSPNLGLHLSHVGRRPITIPPNVKLETTDELITVTGPLGTTTVWHPPYFVVDYPQPQTLRLSVQDPSHKKQRSWWGTVRSLVQNAIVGMTEGFSTPLYLVGVGYRAAMEPDPLGKRPGWTGQRLNMKLGFSHSVYEPIPDHVKVELVSPTKLILSCTDKQQLGLFAAKIRHWRKPEPYKGKVCDDNSVSFSTNLTEISASLIGYICWDGKGEDKVCQKEVVVAYLCTVLLLLSLFRLCLGRSLNAC